MQEQFVDELARLAYETFRKAHIDKEEWYIVDDMPGWAEEDDDGREYWRAVARKLGGRIGSLFAKSIVASLGVTDEDFEA